MKAYLIVFNLLDLILSSVWIDYFGILQVLTANKER